MTLIAAPGLVVVLAGEVLPSVRESVWAAVCAADRSLESVVQTIPLQTLGGTRSFAVSMWEPDEAGVPVLTVVVRGDSVVDVHSPESGRRRFTSQGLRPWHLASFRDVSVVSFWPGPQHGSEADIPQLDGSELPLVSGAASCAGEIGRAHV